MFQGSFVALVTPFRNGAVDYPRIEQLVDFHVRNGTLRHCPVRDHGRIGHPFAPGAQGRHCVHGQVRGGADTGHRRERFELHERSDRADRRPRPRPARTRAC